jgi:hypothetical protein
MDRDKIQSISVFFICVHPVHLWLKNLEMTVLGETPAPRGPGILPGVVIHSLRFSSSVIGRSGELTRSRVT